MPVTMDNSRLVKYQKSVANLNIVPFFNAVTHPYHKNRIQYLVILTHYNTIDTITIFITHPLQHC